MEKDVREAAQYLEAEALYKRLRESVPRSTDLDFIDEQR